MQFKLRLFLVTALLASSQLTAQEAPPKNKVSSLADREDAAIINFTSDNWSNLPSGIKGKPLRSHGFSFLFMTDKMNKSGNIGIGGGIGFMSQNVHTNANIIDTIGASMLSKIPDSLKVEVNKLSSNFITFALELRFRTDENAKGERFKLSTGILAGIMVQNHVKYEDKNGKFKTYDLNHLNKFQYGLYGRLGYNNLALYGYYSLADVFKSGKGPKLTPLSVGISITI